MHVGSRNPCAFLSAAKSIPISVPMWDKRCYIRDSSHAMLLYTRQLTRNVHVTTFHIIMGRRRVSTFEALVWENADENFQTLVTSLLVNKNFKYEYPLS